MRDDTFQKAKAAVDYLSNRGHLKYRVDHACDIVTDGSILNVTVQQIAAQVKNLAKHLAIQPNA